MLDNWLCSVTDSTRQAVTIAVEGVTDAAVVARLFDWLGMELGPAYGQRGKAHLDKHLPAYNNAARFAPWLVVRDLDTDFECAPALTATLLPAPAAFMRLRIAVREVESWLLADRDRIADFLGVAVKRVPVDTDSIGNPKSFLVDLARQSPRRHIKEDLVPAAGSGAKVGAGYPARMIEFARSVWRPQAAVRHSGSLRRCVDALEPWWGAKGPKTTVD
jgi:hypothetical protein